MLTTRRRCIRHPKSTSIVHARMLIIHTSSNFFINIYFNYITKLSLSEPDYNNKKKLKRQKTT